MEVVIKTESEYFFKKYVSKEGTTKLTIQKLRQGLGIYSNFNTKESEERVIVEYTKLGKNLDKDELFAIFQAKLQKEEETLQSIQKSSRKGYNYNWNLKRK